MIQQQKMALTKAQDALLRQLENGFEITFKDKHYVVTGIRLPCGGVQETKIWPSTFYGLFDQGLVEKLDNGNYTVSEDGLRKIRS